jgi:hypothetical protein
MSRSAGAKAFEQQVQRSGRPHLQASVAFRHWLPNRTLTMAGLPASISLVRWRGAEGRLVTARWRWSVAVTHPLFDLYAPKLGSSPLSTGSGVRHRSRRLGPRRVTGFRASCRSSTSSSCRFLIVTLLLQNSQASQEVLQPPCRAPAPCALGQPGVLALVGVVAELAGKHYLVAERGLSLSTCSFRWSSSGGPGGCTMPSVSSALSIKLHRLLCVAMSEP